MQIKKAIILTAGYGKRLNPMTLSKPKSLLEINKKTLLENTIYLLEQFGIEEIFLQLIKFTLMILFLKVQQDGYTEEKDN